MRCGGDQRRQMAAAVAAADEPGCPGDGHAGRVIEEFERIVTSAKDRWVGMLMKSHGIG